MKCWRFSEIGGSSFLKSAGTNVPKTTASHPTDHSLKTNHNANLKSHVDLHKSYLFCGMLYKWNVLSVGAYAFQNSRNLNQQQRYPEYWSLLLYMSSLWPSKSNAINLSRYNSDVLWYISSLDRMDIRLLQSMRSLQSAIKFVTIHPWSQVWFSWHNDLNIDVYKHSS